MTGETRDTIFAYTGYDHSDHSITFLGPTGRVSEFRRYIDILRVDECLSVS